MNTTPRLPKIIRPRSDCSQGLKGLALFSTIPGSMSAQKRPAAARPGRRRRPSEPGGALEEQSVGQIVAKRPAASAASRVRSTSRRPAAAPSASQAIVPADGIDVPSTPQQRAAHNLSRIKFCVGCHGVFADGPRHKNECGSGNRVVTVQELEEYVPRHAGKRLVQPGQFTFPRGKYYRESVAHVHMIDPSYLQWCVQKHMYLVWSGLKDELDALGLLPKDAPSELPVVPKPTAAELKLQKQIAHDKYVPKAQRATFYDSIVQSSRLPLARPLLQLTQAPCYDQEKEPF